MSTNTLVWCNRRYQNVITRDKQCRETQAAYLYLYQDWKER
jgi:hypothetical protein